MDYLKVYRGRHILPVQSENSDQAPIDTTSIRAIIAAGQGYDY